MKKQRLLAMALLSLLAAMLLQWAIAKADQKNQMQEVFILKEPLAAGQFLDLTKCNRLLVSASGKERQTYLTKEALAKRPQIGEALNVGTVLLNSHLQTQRDAVFMHSMVIRLDNEAAHLGGFVPGEQVDALCYRQGQSQRLQGIEVLKIDVVSPLENPVFILTLRGEVSDLETLMLAQSEGIVRIIKKVSIQ